MQNSLAKELAPPLPLFVSVALFTLQDFCEAVRMPYLPILESLSHSASPGSSEKNSRPECRFSFASGEMIFFVFSKAETHPSLARPKSIRYIAKSGSDWINYNFKHLTLPALFGQSGASTRYPFEPYGYVGRNSAFEFRDLPERERLKIIRRYVGR